MAHKDAEAELAKVRAAGLPPAELGRAGVSHSDSLENFTIPRRCYTSAET